ncbi:MAG: UbiD family decarboxylase [Chloroflexi bacterium]|nr:UbiD family decarboxylase [Chloroflexota bacterium]
MAKPDLRTFIELLENRFPEHLAYVEKEIDSSLELMVLQQKLWKERKFPFLLCNRVKGTSMPVVTNLFASYELMGIALGMDKIEHKRDVFDHYLKISSNRIPPVGVNSDQAPVKEVVLKGDDVDLDLLPIMQHATKDSGRYLVIGAMVCRDPNTGIPNIGVYRHEVKDKRTLGCMIEPYNDGSYISKQYLARNETMDVAIFIGHHPAVLIGALTRGGVDLNEFELIGGLLGEPLEVVNGETVDLEIPARSEIVIEGKIRPGNDSTDGPFGEYPRYYGVTEPCSLIDVTAITMRKAPYFHELDPNHPEHFLSTVLAREELLYKAIRKVVPSVTAVNAPSSGCGVFHAYISIRKTVQGEGKLAALAALGAISTLRHVVVVDDDIDVYDEEEVLWAIATRFDAGLGCTVIPNAMGTRLDPTAYGEVRSERGVMTSKMIVDATRPATRPFPERVIPSKEIWDRLSLTDHLRWANE